VSAVATVPAAATGPVTTATGGRRRAHDLVFMAVWLGAFGVLAFVVWPTTLGGATSFTIVSGVSMEPTYHSGDLAVVRRADDIAVGDVIVYRVPPGQPGEGRRVIHRVTGGDGTAGYVTQGDNRSTPDLWHPRRDDVLGRVQLQVPQFGTWALRLLSPVGLGIAAAALFLWVVWPRTDGDPDDGAVTGAVNARPVRRGEGRPPAGRA
jgi:signal peptidase